MAKVSQLALRQQSMLCNPSNPLCSGVIGLFIQQKECKRDPLGPLFFCLAIYGLCIQQNSAAVYRKVENIGGGVQSQASMCKNSYFYYIILEKTKSYTCT